MKDIHRGRRHARIRKSLQGDAARPRLAVFRSGKNIYAQIIDDTKSATLLSFSTVTKEFKEKKLKGTNKDSAFIVGELLAKKAQAQGIKQVCFDRAGYLYHGRVKALAEGARKGGLSF